MIKESSTWKIISNFDNSTRENNINLIHDPKKIPYHIAHRTKQIWKEILTNKAKDLEGKIEIMPCKFEGFEDTYDALYKDGEKLFYPGELMSLNEIQQNNGDVHLKVSKILYPYVITLLEKEGAELNSKSENKIMPFHICTLPITSDGQIVLTYRGKNTLSHPNTLWGVGGNLENPEIGIVNHQEREIQEEILVKPLEYNRENFRFGGIATIKRDGYDNLPGLLGWIPINLTSQEVASRVHQRPFSERPGDAVDVAFAPAESEGLLDYLVKKTNIYMFCPTGHANLYLYGAKTYGKEWERDLLKKSKDFIEFNGTT